ncbi:MAG TPA: LysR substrate-binding domain-containing protein [Polyangiaceae bacterium]|nr:LysR substrate-binding domain-containing protein [Polyangiaceae bacterium]
MFRGPVDDALAALGRRRRVAAALAHFSPLPFALRRTAALANVPSVAAAYYAKAFRLARSPLPFEAPRFSVALLWHARHDADPALDWFRGRIRALVRTLRAKAPPP